MSVTTQGTEIYFVDDLGTLHTLHCPTGITIPRATKDNLDATCLNSEDRVMVPGLGTPPTLSITANFNPDQDSHVFLWEAQENRTILQFIVGLSNGTAAPTLDTAGDVILPTTRGFVTFEGYVSDTPLDAQIGAFYTIDFTIQMSGNSKLIRKVVTP